MQNKKFLSVISLCAAAIVSVSVLGGCSGAPSNAALNSNKAYAEKVVADFASSQNSAEFKFSDQAYAKGTLVSMMFKSDITADELQQIARNLFLTSITVTNEKGEITACYPEGAESGKLKDSKDKAAFNKIVKGISEKLMNDPVYNADADTYSVLAGVKRTDSDGAVIVGFDTDQYADVAGTNLAKSCGPNAVVIKDGKVLSSTLDGIAQNASLDDIGITSDDLNKESFTIKTDDKSYTASASTKNGYTVICAIEA